MTVVSRFVLVAMMALTAAPARAGGSSFVGDSDADDPRTTVFGFVKDKSGDPVEDATVTITMKMLNTDLVVHTDP